VKIKKKKFLDISKKKFGSAYAQSPRKCSNIEILAKIEGKEAKFFSKIYEGHIRIWFRSKKNSKLSHACVPLNWPFKLGTYRLITLIRFRIQIFYLLRIRSRLVTLHEDPDFDVLFAANPDSTYHPDADPFDLWPWCGSGFWFFYLLRIRIWLKGDKLI
jgi:hypothetical protein